jgi:hypothetical protein
MGSLFGEENEPDQTDDKLGARITWLSVRDHPTPLCNMVNDSLPQRIMVKARTSR